VTDSDKPPPHVSVGAVSYFLGCNMRPKVTCKNLSGTQTGVMRLAVYGLYASGFKRLFFQERSAKLSVTWPPD